MRPPRSSTSDTEPTLVEPPEGPGDVNAQRAFAAQLVRRGQAARAVAELLKALRLAPPTAALASELISAARRAGMEPVAGAALEEVWPSAAPREQLALHRLLARLLRRSNRADRARLHLYQLLADAPEDRRAQLALTRVLAREGRHQELDKTLAKVARDASARGLHRLAAQAHLERARTLAEDLGDRASAAASFASAGESYTLAGQLHHAFWARALASAALVASRQPLPTVEASLRPLVEAGRACGREREAVAAGDAMLVGGTEPAAVLAALAASAERNHARRLAVALWEATIESEPMAVAWPAQLVRLFATQRAWFDLAEHHKRCAARPAVAQATAMRATWLGHRAEILEAKLGDLPAAAQARAEAFALGGDRAHLRAQLSLLERHSGPQAAEIALDRSVAGAGDPAIKAAALQVRAERHAAQRRFRNAVADLTRALVLSPLDADGTRLLNECRAEEGEAEAIGELWRAAEALPRGHRERAERFRKLAKLCLWPLGQVERSLAAWAEVLADLPGDPEAEERLVQAARARNKPEELLPILRARIARFQRGPEARQARHELARLLEGLGRADEALESWEEAARAEPGDAAAQLALADRLESRSRFDEAALALEGAAQALDDPSQSGQVWARLGRFYRERMGLPDRAYAAEKRAVALGVLPQSARPRPESLARPTSAPALSAARLRAAPPPPPAPGDPGSLTPTERGLPVLETIAEPPPGPFMPTGAKLQAAPPAPLPVPRPPPPPVPTPPQSVPVAERTPVLAKRETTSGGRRRKRTKTEPHKLPLARAVPAELLEKLNRNPLSAQVHRELAEAADRRGDVLRASLFTEVARALEGDPDAQPMAPRGTLSATELATLRHSELRGPVVEAVALCAEALCAQAAKARKSEPFSFTVGKGAPQAGQALLDTVRLLGVRAPDVVLAAEEGPPFALQNTDPVRLAVGRMAVRKELDPAELRFYAGRALYALRPEVLALRLLETEELAAGLKRAREALLPKHLPLLAAPSLKALLAAVGAKPRERFVELAPALDQTQPDWDRLMALARYTTNRAGLLCAGGVAPALRALLGKRASKEELAELVRFAISDRMVRIRSARR